ncbi:hypothetical protein JHK87_050744 [Glycine soja]|nr:hypothetical protein JHK87_050744 [Glycine soja]
MPKLVYWNFEQGYCPRKRFIERVSGTKILLLQFRKRLWDPPSSPFEKFIGICPKCLYERLTILVQKSYSFVYKAPTSLIVVPAHKPIFQPFATKHI